MKIRVLIAAAALLTLVAASAATAQDSSSEKGTGTVSGQVLEIREAVQTRNNTEEKLTEIKVRTQQRLELWLRLGTASAYGNPDFVKVGDKVRARYMYQGEKDDVMLVQSIKNERTGKKTQVRSADGTLTPDSDQDKDQIRQQDRLRDGTGTGDQDRNQSRDGKQSSGRTQSQSGRR